MAIAHDMSIPGFDSGVKPVLSVNCQFVVRQLCTEIMQVQILSEHP